MTTPQYELDTFLTATEGVGFSTNREFYQTGYGFGFNQYFWIEIGIEPPKPPVVPPVIGGGGLVSYPAPQKPPKHIEQVHVIRFYLKTPNGEIVTHRWEIKKVVYSFLVKYLGHTIIPPKFVVKSIEVISNIYHKIKVRLIR